MATLSWEALSCDWILFLARMCLDYARYLVSEGRIGEAQSYFRTAVYIGRYALCILSFRAAVLIHELGHKLVSGTHCAADCCMSSAEFKWLCRIRGLLGLPDDNYQLTPKTTETPPTSEYDSAWRALTGTECLQCSHDDDGYPDKPELCWVVSNGVPRQHSIYLSGGCMGYYTCQYF
jgi:hypothetical protein